MARTSSVPCSIYSDTAADTSFEGDGSELFEDEPSVSIEHDDPADLFSSIEPIRRVSALTARTNATSIISSMPSELSSHAVRETRSYTPLKARPLFRNPNSFRALQMASPPPFEGYPSPVSGGGGRYGALTPSRTQRSDTPKSSARSSRNHSSIKVHRSSPRPPPTMPEEQAERKKEYPLVLLHITLLPSPSPFPPALMVAVLPEWLQRNIRLLEAKLADPTLMQRGILVPHPREEYELLEERLLESLELRQPRISKCGHFCVPGEEEDGEEYDDSGSNSTAVERGEDKDVDGDDLDEGAVPVCEDCHRVIACPGQPLGTGRQRWDTKVYAANGLMRAGAWAAAWSEMERVDVEISPCIPEGLRRDLERRRNEEEAAMALLEQEEEQKRRVSMEEEEQKWRVLKEEEERTWRALREEDEERITTVVDDGTKHMGNGIKRAELPSPNRSQANIHGPPQQLQHAHLLRPSVRARDVPLSILLQNYIYLLARDRRNIAILLMSMVIVVLCVGQKRVALHDADLSKPFLLVENDTQCSPASLVLTTTTTEIVTATVVGTTVPSHGVEASTPTLLVVDLPPAGEQHSTSQTGASALVYSVSALTSVPTPVLLTPTPPQSVPDTVHGFIGDVPIGQPAVEDPPLIEDTQLQSPAARGEADRIAEQGVTATDILGDILDDQTEMIEG